MSMCYPAETDWSCEYTPEQLAEMRAVPATLAKMKLAEAQAWYLLASLCAYQIGVCPTVVRPCAVGCATPGTWMEAIANGSSTAGLGVRTIGGVFTPYVSGGIWINGCGCRTSDCSCSAVSEVILPGPVGGIDYVQIDGVTLPPTAYRVDNGNRLVRQDGGQWPLCQDMSAPVEAPATFEPVTIAIFQGITVTLSREGNVVTAAIDPSALTDSSGTPTPIPAEFIPAGGGTVQLAAAGDRWLTLVGPDGIIVAPNGPAPYPAEQFQWLADPVPAVAQSGVFAVSYYRGAAPNDLTRAAAGVLAVEFYKACVKAKGCRLPKSVQRVVRGNATYEIDTKLFPEGYTRIEEVDAVIRIYNPYTLKSPPRVLSPDSSAPRRQTWGY